MPEGAPGPWTVAASAQGDALALRKAAHKTLKGVTEAIEGVRFNSAVAQIHDLVNALRKAESGGSGMVEARAETLGILARLISPFIPHLAEECWHKLGGQGLVIDAPWPAVDHSLLVETDLVLPVQVNGKRRGEISVATDLAQESVQQMAIPADAVASALDVRTIP